MQPTRHSDGLAVGTVAAELGLAPETLRSYGRRYGLMPSGRTAGGHRRYTRDDLARLRRMQELITGGVSPARAASMVLGREAEPEALRRPAGPGGRVLAVPGAGPEVRGLARAAIRLDAPALVTELMGMFRRRGAISTWESAIRPLLIAVGDRWGNTGTGIETEHVLSESVIDALRRYRAAQAAPRSGAPVLLASYPEDQHVLPLHAIAAALAEDRVPHLMLGGRMPGEALDVARRRTGARALFLWRQLTGNQQLMPEFAPTRPPLRLVLGGPGWSGNPVPAGAVVARSMTEAHALLRR